MSVEIARLRAEFMVFVVEQNVSAAQSLVETLKSAGFSTVKFFPTLDAALAMARSETPHIVIFDYENFESTADAFLNDLKGISDEIQTLLMISFRQTLQALQVIGRGAAYDSIIRPFVSTLELTQKLDRAALRLYYQFESEQLREHFAAQGQLPDESEKFERTEHEILVPDESDKVIGEATRLFEKLQKLKELDDVTQAFMESQSRACSEAPVLYLKYLPSHASLAVALSVWLPLEKFRGVGVDLKSEDPKRLQEMLHEPMSFQGLRDIMRGAFNRESFTAFPHVVENDVIGVFVVFAEIPPIEFERWKILRQGFDLAWRRNHLLKEKHSVDINDPVTGVLNRKQFTQKLDEEVGRSRRIMMPVSIVVFDIDGFRALNETLGAQHGDAILRAVATVLKKTARLNDFVARTGSDEFTLILPHTPASGAVQKAELARRIVEATRIPVLNGITLTVSCGVSEYPSLSLDAEMLVRSADEALSQVRESGSNKVCVATVPEIFEPDFIAIDPTATPSAPLGTGEKS